MLTRATGRRPDTIDHQDFQAPMLYTAPTPPAVHPLPTVVDLAPFAPPVRDQLQVGRCTAMAGTGFLMTRQKQAGLPVTELSPDFLYWEERSIEGDVGADGGAMSRTCMKVLQQVGVAPLVDEPLSPTLVTAAPSAMAVAAAKANRIRAYYSIPTLRVLQRTLAWGHPAIIGIPVYRGIESDQCLTTGVIPLPAPGEDPEGGHELLVLGYDDQTERVKVQNSWGLVGDKGYFYIPYPYLERRDIGWDSWTGVL